MPTAGMIIPDNVPHQATKPSGKEKEEWRKKGITNENFRKHCFACGRTGQAHIFNDECQKFN